MNMPPKQAHANACPARPRALVAHTCCYSRIRQGSREVARPDCCSAQSQRRMPEECFTGLYYDPCVRCYRVSDGRHPAQYNYHPTLPECIPADGVYCSRPCCVKPPPCPNPGSCAELLESVIAAQRALSQILCAEADKLMKAVASTDDLNLLLAVNQEVNCTLVDVTFLEQALYHELEQIREICDPCGSEPECAQ